MEVQAPKPEAAPVVHLKRAMKKLTVAQKRERFWMGLTLGILMLEVLLVVAAVAVMVVAFPTN